MEKTYKEYLEEILCSPVSDQLTGNQKQAVDAMAELLGFCDYEKLCELAKADRDGRCVIRPVKLCTPVWSSVFCRVDDDGIEHPTYPWEFDDSMLSEWGTGWHLTEEDALKALED